LKNSLLPSFIISLSNYFNHNNYIWF